MRFVVKKWGNGLAIRLPRNSAELGRLEEGITVEAHLRPVKNTAGWKPVTFRSGRSDMSVRHDEYIWGYMTDKYGNVPRIKTPTRTRRPARKE